MNLNFKNLAYVHLWVNYGFCDTCWTAYYPSHAIKIYLCMRDLGISWDLDLGLELAKNNGHIKNLI